MVAVIRLYRLVLSPLLGGHCRFEPTCSCYALEAYRLHGPIRGTRLTVQRILRCQPLCKGGYDPVPIPPTGPASPPAKPSR
ncbi:MAG: membrane protein insertion efficiency factor YidD [Planctomycetota bacterium]